MAHERVTVGEHPAQVAGRGLRTRTSKEVDLRDLAQLAKLPGFTASDIYDSKQTNNDMSTSLIDNRYAKHVSFVMTK